MLHIHFGPSPLALALLLPICEQCGLDTCLIGRSGKAEPEEYVLQWESGDPERRRVAWACGPDAEAQLPAEVRDRLRDSDVPLLITVTLRERISARRGLLEEILTVRRSVSAKDTIVIPCENSVPGDWSEITSAFDDVARFPGAVIDRVALLLTDGDTNEDTPRERAEVLDRLDPDVAISDDTRVVRTHRTGMWILEETPGSAVMTALAKHPQVDTVPWLAPHEDRKIWMVNGGHLVLGTLARNSARSNLHTVAAHPPHAYLIGHLHRAMNEALAYKYQAETPRGGYFFGADRLKVYSEVMDKVSRVVGKYRRHDLAPYLADLEKRVFRPANHLAASVKRDESPWAEGAMEPFETVLDAVDALLENLYLAEDWDTIDVGTLSDEADAAAISVYERLARGWLAPDAAERRIREITDLLRDHREAYQG